MLILTFTNTFVLNNITFLKKKASHEMSLKFFKTQKMWQSLILPSIFKKWHKKCLNCLFIIHIQSLMTDNTHLVSDILQHYTLSHSFDITHLVTHVHVNLLQVCVNSCYAGWYRFWATFSAFFIIIIFFFILTATFTILLCLFFLFIQNLLFLIVISLNFVLFFLISLFLFFLMFLFLFPLPAAISFLVFLFIFPWPEMK